MISTVTSPIQRDQDIREFFCEAGFDHHRELDIHKIILGEERLGNMKFVSEPSLILLLGILWLFTILRRNQ